MLGQADIKKNDLLRLSLDWRTKQKWGCYINAITGKEIINEAGFELYVGGSPSRQGVCTRMGSYISEKRRGISHEEAPHVLSIMKPTSSIDLRLIAEFEQLSIPRPYDGGIPVGLLESLSVYLEVLQTAWRSFHSGATQVPMDMIIECTLGALQTHQDINHM